MEYAGKKHFVFNFLLCPIARLHMCHKNMQRFRKTMLFIGSSALSGQNKRKLY